MRKPVKPSGYSQYDSDAHQQRKRIADACVRIANTLDKILAVLTPPKATRLCGSWMEIDVKHRPACGAPFRPLRAAGRSTMAITVGNHFYDLVGLQFSLAPNGTLDGPPVWSIDPPDIGVGLTPAADGLSATLFVDNDVAAFTVTAQAPADNPSTPDLESVSESFVGSFSHSKATSLGGSFSEIPR